MGPPYEPNVPKFPYSMEGYEELLNLLGHKRVVLRIDPIFSTNPGIKKAIEVRTRAFFFTDSPRFRISFLDNYDHIKNRFVKEGLTPFDYEFHAPLELRKEMYAKFGNGEICGEPGFPCTGCVSALDCEILGVKPSSDDKGQRKSCPCLANKKELLTRRTPCKHNCVYCYWKREGE